MDQTQFASLTKKMAAATSRRTGFKVLAGALTAAVTGRVISGETPGAEAIRFCRFPGQPCNDKQLCCSRKCVDGVCGCLQRGKTCYQNVGLACCSGKCNKGKCK